MAFFLGISSDLLDIKLLRIAVLECVYTRFDLGIDPGVDVTKVLVDVFLDIFAKLSKHNVFSLIQSDKLSVLIEVSLFLKRLI